jgi:hypothetical protein
MRRLGWVTAVLIILGVVGGTVIGVRSIPDLRRYAEIRRM